jgi:HEAT repeat protein
MGTDAAEILKSAVTILGLSMLGAAATIYLLMEIHFHRQLARQARRVILENRLSPAPAEDQPEVFWSKSSRRDQEIILDILVDQADEGGSQGQNAIRQTLIGLGVMDDWLHDLRHGSVAGRVRAAMRLASVRDPSGVEALVRAAEDSSWQVRLAVTLALGRLKDPAGVQGLIRVAQNLSRTVPDLTLAAALAACAEKDPALLAELVRSPQARLRILASWALSEVADRSVLDALLEITSDPDPEVRAKSARALARVRERESVAALTRLAKDPVWFVRVRALDALGELGEGEEAAFAALEDPVREVRARAAFALRQIDGMKGEVAAKVLAVASRRGFNSLISEWDRAGFLWEVVKGLSTRDWGRYRESVRTVRILIDAGVTHSLAHFVLVFPDLKVRLRLVRLFRESQSPDLRAEILALAGQPGCHALVKREIMELFSSAAVSPAAAAGQAGGS